MGIQVRADAVQLKQFGYRQELRRVLGFFDAFALQFSIIALLGNILFLFQWGVATTGAAFLWAWMFGNALQLSVGLSIAEVASAYPLAGSCYTWIRQLHGNALGWLTGYILIVARISTMAAIDYTVAPYVLQVAHVSNPSGMHVLAAVVACVVVQTAISISSIRAATLISNIRVAIEILTVSVVIVALAIVGVRQNPAILLHTTGTTTHEHMPPFLLVLLVSSGIITSFDSVSNVAEEVRNPSRNVPRGLMTANLVAFAFGVAFIAVSLLATTDLGKTISGHPSLLGIMQTRLGIYLGGSFEVVTLASYFVSAAMLQVTTARLIWAQARDGSLPGLNGLYKLNEKGTPARAALLCAVIVVLAGLWRPALGFFTALGAEAFAVPYGVMVAVSLHAKMRGRLPISRAWNLGRWGIVNNCIALLWSIVLAALVPVVDVVEALGGFVVALALGLLIYVVWVRPRWHPADVVDTVPSGQIGVSVDDPR